MIILTHSEILLTTSFCLKNEVCAHVFYSLVAHIFDTWRMASDRSCALSDGIQVRVAVVHAPGRSPFLADMDETQAECPHLFLHHLLPPELWLVIFKSSSLSDTDLQNVTLAQRSFRRLGQPLLFNHFSMSNILRYDEDLDDIRIPYQSREYIDRFRHRIAFIISERIAPAVTSISITCTRFIALDEAQVLVECTEIITSLFSELGRFHNLRDFDAHSINFTGPMITALYAVPQLQTLSLNQYSIISTVEFPGIAPSNKLLRFSNASGKDFARWTPFLSRKKTESISLPGEIQSNDLLRFISLGKPMLALESLQITHSSTGSALFVDAMTKCPALTQLWLSEPFDLSTDSVNVIRLLESGALPHVDCAIMPHGCASAFVRSRPVCTLVVTDFMDIDVAISFANEVYRNRPLISYLHLFLKNFDYLLLESLFLLRCLEVLYLDVSELMTTGIVEKVRCTPFLVVPASHT